MHLPFLILHHNLLSPAQYAWGSQVLTMQFSRGTDGVPAEIVWWILEIVCGMRPEGSEQRIRQTT